jgi:drug/metabolite transporter (DMT)-like permease
MILNTLPPPRFSLLALPVSMTMTDTRRAYLELHVAVFLWGFTAILGDLIRLPALHLVWWRVLLTSLSLIFLLKWRSAFSQLTLKMIAQFAFVGILTGLHWLTFYGAIKLSNASVALVCMATCAFFTAIIEPFILKERVKWLEIGVGFLVVPGMALIVENVNVSMRTGIWVGLLSAMLAAFFSTLNKKWVQNAAPFPITFIEMSSAWVFLTLVLPFYANAEPGNSLLPKFSDFFLLLVLALLCTTLTWVLSLRSLRHLSAFASTLTVNLEPVYGIFLAWLLLDDAQDLSSGFYWGVMLILAVVFGYPVLSKFLRRSNVEPDGDD